LAQDTRQTAGVVEFSNDILPGNVFTYPKSVYTVADTIDASLKNAKSGLTLDFFAGSGTTGHAVINLNREDGGRRKFILVEMADYFDTVLLPRIKKVTFTPEWKDGKPKRMATPEEAERSPRIVKVIRLESYEDALNNLTFEEQSGQQALDLFRDDYLLSYMLQLGDAPQRNPAQRGATASALLLQTPPPPRRGRNLRQRRLAHPRRALAGSDLQRAHVCKCGGMR
jgi:hypothetical protein